MEDMSKLGIPDLIEDKLEASIQDTEDGVVLAFSGMIEMMNAPAVRDFLENAHAKIVEAGLKHVYADMSGLKVLTSVGVRHFAHWLLQIHKAGDRSYELVFYYDPQVSWQEVTFSNIVELVPDHASLKPRPASL